MQHTVRVVGGPHDGEDAPDSWGCTTLVKHGRPADPAYTVDRSFYNAVYAPDMSLMWIFDRTERLGTRTVIDAEGLPRPQLYPGPTIW